MGTEVAMKRTLATTLAAVLLLLAFTASTPALEKSKKADYSPKVKKWLNKEITVKFDDYRLDTCIAICKIISGADMMFEVGTKVEDLPKINYYAKGYRLSKVLDDILGRTKFDWKVVNDTILIVKRTY